MRSVNFPFLPAYLKIFWGEVFFAFSILKIDSTAFVIRLDRWCSWEAGWKGSACTESCGFVRFRQIHHPLGSKCFLSGLLCAGMCKCTLSPDFCFHRWVRREEPWSISEVCDCDLAPRAVTGTVQAGGAFISPAPSPRLGWEGFTLCCSPFSSVNLFLLFVRKLRQCLYLVASGDVYFGFYCWRENIATLP